MKRVGIVSLLWILVLCLVIPLASADDPVIITPYQGGPDFEVEAGKDVFIRAGWSACTRGLTRAFSKNALLSMEIQQDGSPYLVVEPPSREYWSDPFPAGLDTSPCVMKTDNYWSVEWLYPLGALDPGTYDVHFLYYLEHKFPDGGDYDGDGRIDIFDFFLERDITIIVN
jgi:hypothetical protein